MTATYMPAAMILGATDFEKACYTCLEAAPGLLGQIHSTGLGRNEPEGLQAKQAAQIVFLGTAALSTNEPRTGSLGPSLSVEMACLHNEHGIGTPAGPRSWISEEPLLRWSRTQMDIFIGVCTCAELGMRLCNVGKLLSSTGMPCTNACTRL